MVKFQEISLIQRFDDKSTYLKSREHIEGVSSAELHLSLLEAYDKEFESVNSTSLHVRHVIEHHLTNLAIKEPYSRTHSREI